MSFSYKRIGFILLGIFACLYATFMSYFAELHIQLPFLDFPVFVGEMLLIFCSILLLLIWKSYPDIRVGRWHYIFLFYFIWMLIKALYGYWLWGPLAFRNAALFYYPIFFVFGYYFYDPRFFSQKIIFLSLSTIAIVTLCVIYYEYYRVTLFVLFIVLAMRVDRSILRSLMLFLAIVFFPIKKFFIGMRGDLLATCVSFSYFGISSMLTFFKLDRRRRFWISGLIILGVLFTGWQFGQKREILSMFAFQELVKLYQAQEVEDLILLKNFEFKHIEPKLYNPNTPDKFPSTPDTFRDRLLPSVRIFEQAIALSGGLRGEPTAPSLAAPAKPTAPSLAAPAEPQALVEGVKVQSIERDVHAELVNILFRIRIWKDMIIEMVKERALLGINFGKPQRSISIALTQHPDWLRDGWVTPHNSFLHMLYRGGIVGAALVITLFNALYFLAKRFIALRSITGILLTGSLIYWSVLSCFGVILELPYNAIPFWSLFGVTFAYLHRVLEIKNNKEGTHRTLVLVSENTYNS